MPMHIFAIDGNAIIAMIAKIKVQDSNQGLVLGLLLKRESGPLIA